MLEGAAVDDGVITIGRHRLIHGDCIEATREMEPDSVDALITDPPYGLGFMGKKWDALPPGIEWARECLRVAKPGAHLIAFGGQRTIHRLTCALEDASWEIRDQLQWLQWQGFPKSLDISKAIDKGEGIWRGRAGAVTIESQPSKGREYERTPKGDAVTEDARRWEGWGTALKPAAENAVLARKPISERSIAANVLRWGTGAINVDACRYAYGDPAWPGPQEKHAGYANGPGGNTFSVGVSPDGSRDEPWAASDLGRFPANVYACPKASRSEREAGLTAENMLCSCKPKERTWASADQSRSTTLERAPSTGLDTTESSAAADSSWLTDGSGSRPTDPSQSGTTSTTSTGSGSTTGSATSNSLTSSRTSESTAGANSETASGGSPVPTAGNSSPSASRTGTSAKKAGRSMAAADRATSGALSSPNVCDDCGKRLKQRTGFEAVGRAEGSAALSSPRTGAGRTAKAVWCDHPTCKPIALMRWLVRLVTPPGGTVLEPFAGSGTTMIAADLEGFASIGIEREADYLPIIQARLRHWAQAMTVEEATAKTEPGALDGQQGLF